MTDDLVLSCKYVSRHSSLFPSSHLLFSPSLLSIFPPLWGFFFFFSFSLLHFTLVSAFAQKPTFAPSSPIHTYCSFLYLILFSHPIFLSSIPPPSCIPVIHSSSHPTLHPDTQTHTDGIRGPSECVCIWVCVRACVWSSHESFTVWVVWLFLVWINEHKRRRPHTAP